MRQYKSKPRSANEAIRRRIEAWEAEDPASLLTNRATRVSESLQSLIALLLPGSLVQSVIEKTFWAIDPAAERQDILKKHQCQSLSEIPLAKIDRCDALADSVQRWAASSAAELTAWDSVGPLDAEPAIAALLGLAIRAIKKIGLCFGFETSSREEELIVLEIFAAGSALSRQDKTRALKAIGEIVAKQGQADARSQDAVFSKLGEIAKNVSENLAYRRAFASSTAFTEAVAGSTNAWLVNDVANAARNTYAQRRFTERTESRSKAKEKRATEAQAPLRLPKAA